MTDSIFNKEDFRLCMVPVPSGYPQSQTHVGVLYHNGSVFMTTSPFPNPVQKRNVMRYLRGIIRRLSGNRIFRIVVGEVYENPCIYEGIGEQPIVFNPISCNPLVEKPDKEYGGRAYNSDPDIFMLGGEIFVLNRQYYRRPDDQPIVRIQLLKGIVEDHCFKLKMKDVIYEGTSPFVSPSICSIGDQIVLCYLDTYSVNNIKKFNAVYIYENVEPLNIQMNNQKPKKVRLVSKYQPWHLSLFCHKVNLYAIVTCVNPIDNTKLIQTLGVFNNNLDELRIYDTPLTTMNSYRGAGFVLNNDMFVFYNTSVNEFFKESKSVDGREVCLVSCDFQTLIHNLNKK